MDKKKTFCNPEIWGGIECTVNRVNDAFFDQLAYIDFYNKPLLDSITSLGIKKLRFPILWEKHQPEKDGAIDWHWTRQQIDFLNKEGVEVIAGLVHHGSGPAYTNLLDPQFPEGLAAYARKVAEAFPQIEYYTPVNEPLTTARFSGLYGIWYPHHRSDSSFLQMLLHELKGAVLAMQEIRKINPAAKLVQTEDLAKTYSTPKLKYQARFENERRWLTYDILCGKLNVQHPLWKFFLHHGIQERDLHFFIENPCTPDIFGFNYYLTSERFLDENLDYYPPHTHGTNGRHYYADVEAVRVEVEEETGIEVLVKEAWERFGQPISITEVHLHCHREEQLRWFKHIWEASKKLTRNGIDIRGITTWAMLGSVGWSKLLTEPGGEYEPGVFDMRSGSPRPTALHSFIQQLTRPKKSWHPLSQDKGWWQRDSRFIYVPSLHKITSSLKRKKKHPVLIIGKNGTLGKAFAKICEHRRLSYRILDRSQCDLNDPASIEQAIDYYKPWAIINAAGYVRVDEAENEVEKCFRDNYYGVINLAHSCKRAGIKLITFSTDLVFDGKKNEPYVESDIPNPLNRYGQSKWQCEQKLSELDENALLIRTSAFFGPWDKHNFLHAAIESTNALIPFYACSDTLVSPTYIPDLVHATLDLLIDDEKGSWHLANRGAISWSDFALEAVRSLDLDDSFIIPVRQKELNLPAHRPMYSVLGSEKGHILPTLENAMQRFYEEKAPHSVTAFI